MMKCQIDNWGAAGTWRGYKTRDGKIDGRQCRIVLPPNPRPGRLWVWKPEFLDAFPMIDEEMINRGFYWISLDVSDHYGCPKAIAHGNALYEFLTCDLGFHSRTAFAALSRGGLYAYNWAAANPGKVAAIYADNAVADFKSWPGGKGIGPGSMNDWEKCLAVHGLTEKEAFAYPHNPVDTAYKIAADHIPLFQVFGARDEIVPIAENALRIQAIWKEAGAPYFEIIKKDGLHHPHGLEDPAPVVEFFEEFI